ncbi:LapA family protein [Phytoactinopolyspora halotolerans]|uniref:LapA family protein n=1 Tax=Phytoactinopolyspora halotolerans TaxID=1981512 RepID=A0A6L9SF33_9ACTN|nr:LapA family protein [Phytoactinopolyspora halotolerans]NEE03111.1 LapA family protein [Phytoactinopolyspora halotolerans]
MAGVVSGDPSWSGAPADAHAELTAAPSATARTRGRRPAPSPARVSIEIGVTCLVLGVTMGAVWYLLAPDLIGQVVEGGNVVAPIEQARQLFDQIAIFFGLGVLIGLVLGSFFGVRHRRRPVTVLVALAVGGLGGSLLALAAGSVLGPSAASGPPGTEVAIPLRLEAPAALFAWPVVAVVVVTIMSLFRDDRTPWVWNGGSARQ